MRNRPLRAGYCRIWLESVILILERMIKVFGLRDKARILLSVGSFVLCLFVLATASVSANDDYTHQIVDGEVYLVLYHGDSVHVEIPEEVAGYPVATIGWRLFYDKGLLGYSPGYNNEDIQRGICRESINLSYPSGQRDHYG